MSREQREKARMRTDADKLWEAWMSGEICTLHGVDWIGPFGCALCNAIERDKRKNEQNHRQR